MNNVSLTGRIGKRAEVGLTKTGKKVAKVSVAVYRNEEHTDWIQCVGYENNATRMEQAQVGDFAEVSGSINARSYDNQEGKKVYVTEVMVNFFNSYKTEKRESSQPAGRSQQTSKERELAEIEKMFDQMNDAPILDISSDDLPF